MKREHLITALFIALAVIIFYLSYLIFEPFFGAIFWGIILAMLFFPLYKKMLKRIKRKSICSALMCILIFLIIIGPFISLGIVLVDEAVDAYHTTEKYIRSGEYQSLISLNQHPFVISIRQKIEQYVDTSNISISTQILTALNKIQSFVIRNIGSTVQRLSQFILDFIFVFLTMYYLFKDGENLVGKFKGIIPLNEIQTNNILNQMKEVSQATIYGGLIVSLLQGFLGGLAFFIVGISSPVFWGALMALLSFFPLIGAWLVFLPAVIVLLFQGFFGKGIFLLIWGFGVVSMVDNFLRPYLVSGRTEIHPLILFFSILGGLQVFGFIGIILGPMLASVFVVFINIMQNHLKQPDTDIPT